MIAQPSTQGVARTKETTMKNVPIAKVGISMKTFVFALFLLAALAIAFFALPLGASFAFHSAASSPIALSPGW